MPIHHLASSPPWPPRARYESPVVENSDPSVEDFDGPGLDNEVLFFSKKTIINLTHFIN